MGAALPGYMGAALGLLLVFRNNSAYDKWWEARKEIGGLVNTARNFVITSNTVLPFGSNDKNKIGQLVIAFTYALKEHLRDGVKLEELENLEEEDFRSISESNHKPNIIINILGKKVDAIFRNKEITDLQNYLLLDKMNMLIDILGRCERIKNTPIPKAYVVLLNFFINIYVIVLPLGLINDLGWWSILLVIILYYILMSIVLTAEEIEEPFGKDLNDISMDEIAAKIKRDVIELIKKG